MRKRNQKNIVAKYLEILEKESTARNRSAFLKQGASEKTFGVGVTTVRKVKSQLKAELQDPKELYSVCRRLFKTGYTEARILACLACPVEELDKSQLRRWGKSIDFHRLADLFVDELLMKTAWAEYFFKDWRDEKNEYQRRCAYRVLRRQALLPDPRPDDFFIDHLYQIEKRIHDTQPFARQAMNDCLMGIGMRNRKLNTVAMTVAKRIGKLGNEEDEIALEFEDAAKILASKKVQSQLPD